MAAIYNPTPFSLFSVALQRSVAGEEVVDGLTDEQAEAACASGVFVRGVVVVDEPESEPEEKTQRPTGRATSKRGSVEVEEVVTTKDDIETR